MKDLIKKEVIVALIAIMIFVVAFTLLGGWSAEGAERYVDIAAAAGIVAAMLAAGGAFTAGVDAVILSAAAVAAFATAVGFVAGGAFAATAVGLAAGVVIADKLQQYKGKVLLSLFVQAVVIFGSITAMVFV